MPSTLNGTGTIYYGKREQDFRGTYVTTKWLAVLWVPLLPLSSWRVYPLSEGHVDYITEGSSRESSVFEATRVPLNWKQVINVYAIGSCGVAIAYLAIHSVFPGIL